MSKSSLGVYLVIDNVRVPSDALPLYQILKQSDNWLWRYCISKIWGYRKCRHECSWSSARGVSNFNMKAPQGRGGGGLSAYTVVL